MQTLIILSSEWSLNAIQEIWYGIKKWWENKIWNILLHGLAVPIQHWEQGKGPSIRIRCDSADFILIKRLKDVVKVE